MIGNRREGTNWVESRKHALHTRTAFVLSYPDFQHVRCVMAEASLTMGSPKCVFISTATKAKYAYFSLVIFSQIRALLRGVCLVSS